MIRYPTKIKIKINEQYKQRLTFDIEQIKQACADIAWSAETKPDPRFQ